MCVSAQPQDLDEQANLSFIKCQPHFYEYLKRNHLKLMLRNRDNMFKFYEVHKQYTNKDKKICFPE